MKLLCDLVVNHTSHEHAAFKESSSSTDNPKKDWYIWRPAKYDAEGNRQPPNNWVSFFCGSAWTWCEARQEYYLGIFCPQQPDLNWENPEVREFVYSVARFWLDRGASGFRIDVACQWSKTYINDGSKYPPLPDAPIVDPHSKYQPATQFFCDGPRIHEFVREFNEKVLSHYDTFTVGESPFLNDPRQILYWTHPARNELRMNFHFEIVTIDCDPMAPIKPRDWTLETLKRETNLWQTSMHRHNGWNSNYSCNHDQCRPVSRWANDTPQYRKQAAKMLALHQATLGGTIYVYQGEELGMKNIPEDWPIEEYKDIMTINYYNECMDRKKQGDKDAPDAATVVKWASMKARDNGRTPVQWNAGPHGGFTNADAKPWMRAMTEDAQSGWNAEDESKDPNSVFNFWIRALQARKAHKDTIIYGGFALLAPKDQQIFAYARYQEGYTTTLVVLNFSDKVGSVTVDNEALAQAGKEIEEKYRPAGQLPDLSNVAKQAHLLLETTDGVFKGWEHDGKTLKLAPYEGVLFALQ